MDEAGSPAWPGTNTVSTRIGKTLSPIPDDNRTTLPAACPAPFRAPVKPAPSQAHSYSPQRSPASLPVNASTPGQSPRAHQTTPHSCGPPARSCQKETPYAQFSAKPSPPHPQDRPEPSRQPSDDAWRSTPSCPSYNIAVTECQIRLRLSFIRLDSEPLFGGRDGMKQRWSGGELAQFRGLNGDGKQLCEQRTRQGAIGPRRAAEVCPC